MNQTSDNLKAKRSKMAKNYKIKRCPICGSKLKLTQIGKFNKIWKCPNCPYTETLMLAGIWHPNNRPKH